MQGNQYFLLPSQPDPNDRLPRNAFGYLIGFGRGCQTSNGDPTNTSNDWNSTWLSSSGYWNLWGVVDPRFPSCRFSSFR